MTAHRTTLARLLSPRRAAVVAAVGAGVVLIPLPALAQAPSVPGVTSLGAYSATVPATPSVSARTAVAAPVSYRMPVVAPSGAAQTVVSTVLAQLGKPYVWAGAGPNGFDCSGLTQFAYRAAGISLPHFTGAQAQMGRAVAPTELAPGDLVFFYGLGHVGIYVGNGQVAHAPTSGDVVKVTPIQYMGGITTVRRLV